MYQLDTGCVFARFINSHYQPESKRHWPKLSFFAES